MKENIADNFIDKHIKEYLKKNKNGLIITRFPPEPNGFLHIGHVKSICINFHLAKKYKGLCYLRFDNTNPKKEKNIFIESIKEDINWLGFKWDKLSYTTDYFEKLYEFAIKLIKNGQAYVCSLNFLKIKEYRGTLKEKGKNSPYRNRSVEENLKLFEKMKKGQYKEGKHVLRAKINMHAENINMRDPIIYRILKEEKEKTKENFPFYIFPMYDFAHSLSDAIENITHSICTLEFEDHRPLYNWFIKKVFNERKSQQIEFARLNVSHLITSKRILKKIVDKNIVSGWDDPRMPTIAGMRKRGFTATGIKNFCFSLGVSKSKSLIKIELLEKYIREDLEKVSIRRMAVINPILVNIINLKEGINIKALNHPKKPDLGFRNILFSKYIYIEENDFCENPNKDYKRLSKNNYVRLRHAYVIKVEKVIKNSSGKILEIQCLYDKETLNKKPLNYTISGVIHWVEKKTSKKIDIILYYNLFNKENNISSKELEVIENNINSKSKEKLKDCLIENDLGNLYCKNTRYQFERIGYFFVDQELINNNKLLFKRVLSLKNLK